MTTSQKLDTRMPLNKKNFLILGGAILGVVVLAITLVLIFLQPSGTASKLESSTFKNITNAVTVSEDPPASIVVAPATDKWWGNLLAFSVNPLSDVNFNEIDDKAIYVAYTLSSGKEFQSYQAIGLPTHFIVYEDNASAVRASQKIGTDYDHVVADNMLLFVPMGAYSDVDYALEQFDKISSTSEASDLNLQDEAMWQINIGQFNKIYLEGKKEEDVKTVKEFIALMGLTDKSSWVGYSGDGLNWDGKLSNTSIAEVPSAESVEKFLMSQQFFINPDGTLITDENSDKLEAGASGIPRQSLVLSCCLIVSDNKTTIGNLTSSSDGALIESKPLKEKEGLLKIEILSNQWLSLMVNNTNVYPVSQFDKVDVVLKNMSGDISIKLAPLKIN